MEIIDIKMHKHITHKLEQERDQYKAENEKLRERNKELEKRCNQKVRRYLRGGLQQMRIVDLESKYNAMKTERDILIDDLKVLREKNEDLKEEMKRLHEESNIIVFCALMEENSELNKENEKLTVESKQYTTLIDHIRLKASANPGVSRYIALVNFIDRLEGEDKQND